MYTLRCKSTQSTSQLGQRTGKAGSSTKTQFVAILTSSTESTQYNLKQFDNQNILRRHYLYSIKYIQIRMSSNYTCNCPEHFSSRRCETTMTSTDSNRSGEHFFGWRDGNGAAARHHLSQCILGRSDGDKKSYNLPWNLWLNPMVSGLLKPVDFPWNQSSQCR